VARTNAMPASAASTPSKARLQSTSFGEHHSPRPPCLSSRLICFNMKSTLSIKHICGFTETSGNIWMHTNYALETHWMEQRDQHQSSCSSSITCCCTHLQDVHSCAASQPNLHQKSNEPQAPERAWQRPRREGWRIICGKGCDQSATNNLKLICI